MRRPATTQDKPAVHPRAFWVASGMEDSSLRQEENVLPEGNPAVLRRIRRVAASGRRLSRPPGRVSPRRAPTAGRGRHRWPMIAPKSPSANRSAITASPTARSGRTGRRTARRGNDCPSGLVRTPRPGAGGVRVARAGGSGQPRCQSRRRRHRDHRVAQRDRAQCYRRFPRHPLREAACPSRRRTRRYPDARYAGAQAHPPDRRPWPNPGQLTPRRVRNPWRAGGRIRSRHTINGIETRARKAFLGHGSQEYQDPVAIPVSATP